MEVEAVESMKKRILVIDDELQIRLMLRQAIEKAGFEVDDAPDGREGIDCFKKRRADLIITDIIMPEKEGIETIMAFKRIDPGVKIIAISGGGRIQSEDYLNIATKVGASCSFAKPFSIIELLSKINELLKIQ